MQLLTGEDQTVNGQARRRGGRRRMRRVGGGLRRTPVIVGRLLLWALVLVLLARSGLGLFEDLRSGGVEPAVAPAAPETLLAPSAAEGFAVRFVHDYLTYDAAHVDNRATRLAAYIPPGSDDQFGWDGIGEQTVHAVVSLGAVAASDDAAVVTVAALVDDARWLQLLVPIHADDAGRMAVTAAPALVPFTPPAEAAQRAPSVDPDLSRSLEPVLESFFRAYGEGGPEELAYFVPVGHSIPGLQGLMSFEELNDVRVGNGNGDRTAQVQVRWRDRSTGAALTQQYELGLTEEAGRWYVTRLGPAEATSLGGSQ